MAYKAFWAKAPPGRKKIFQKEQPVMVKKPSLSIHIELYIIYPFPNNKYWRTFFSFFHLGKVILPDFSLIGFKKKRIWIWKRKNFLGRRKKSLLIRPCSMFSVILLQHPASDNFSNWLLHIPCVIIILNIFDGVVTQSLHENVHELHLGSSQTKSNIVQIQRIQGR